MNILELYSKLKYYLDELKEEKITQYDFDSFLSSETPFSPYVTRCTNKYIYHAYASEIDPMVFNYYENETNSSLSYHERLVLTLEYILDEVIPQVKDLDEYKGYDKVITATNDNNLNIENALRELLNFVNTIYLNKHLQPSVIMLT